MKFQFNKGNNNTQVSDDPNTTQIQIGFSWKYIAIPVLLIVVFGLMFLKV